MIQSHYRHRWGFGIFPDDRGWTFDQWAKDIDSDMGLLQVVGGVRKPPFPSTRVKAPMRYLRVTIDIPRRYKYTQASHAQMTLQCFSCQSLLPGSQHM